MFDDTAKKVIGKSAQEMAAIKAQDEKEFRRVLNQAKYRQFEFSVKSSMETWNDESRLKISVANAEVVDYKDKKYIERLKAEIQALQEQE
jgi:replication factor A1